MKKILFISILTFNAMLHSNSQSFFQLSFKTLTGDSLSAASYAGKKTLFFIAPLNSSDSNFVQLQAFKNRYLDTIRIVCVLSIEDGFLPSAAASAQSLYSGMGMVLTEGMYTKKSSGTNQSSIFKWLTNKSGNLHFDMDADGIGHKFFVNENGRLFAVMPPAAPLNSAMIDKIVHSGQ